MSARRAARAGKRGLAGSVEVDGVPIAVPHELLDAADPLWADRDRYRSWMDERGWFPPAADRIEGGVAHPANRRNHAAAAWARENGLSADWNALARLGLMSTHEQPPTNRRES